MLRREFWVQTIEKSWRKRPLVWLSGVRRVGKTTIAKMFSDSIYLNCDLPSVKRRLEDPESFFHSIFKGKIVIFDEVHKLQDPGMVLKIGVDEFPGIRLLATGSSTLDATRKFSDSLTGRKTVCYLPPVLWDECTDIFHMPDLDRRLLFGGLPEFLLSEKQNEGFYAEWMDSFYARDIQELFNVRNRSGYLQLMHLLFRNSGNQISLTRLAGECSLTRPTVVSYLESLSVANAIYLLKPFHGGGNREIVSQGKCYAFDTGFVSYVRGWKDIRDEDRGILWEHLVLDILRTALPFFSLYYWKDKSDREIDFVIRRSPAEADTVECKINPEKFDGKALKEFRKLYPVGNNFCFSPAVKEPYTRKLGDYKVTFAGRLDHLMSK